MGFWCELVAYAVFEYHNNILHDPHHYKIRGISRGVLEYRMSLLVSGILKLLSTNFSVHATWSDHETFATVVGFAVNSEI